MPDDGIIKKIEKIKDKEQGVLKKPDTENKKIEQISAPESEISPEKPVMPEILTDSEEKKAGKEGLGAVPGGVLPPISQAQKDREKKIEKILEEGLDDIYIKMLPETQIKFKREGEETTKKISLIIESGKVKIKKIIELIRKWLSIIPGVNKFFLEQEAKIKADKIMKDAINRN